MYIYIYIYYTYIYMHMYIRTPPPAVHTDSVPACAYINPTPTGHPPRFIQGYLAYKKPLPRRTMPRLLWRS